MFWETFIKLCTDNNTRPNPVAAKLGISSGAVTKWKNGATPNSVSLHKIADYFGVTTDYLLGTKSASETNLSSSVDKIIALLEKNNISDETFCRDLNMPLETFKDWKSGKSKPITLRLMKIADYFGVPISELEDDEDKEKKLKMQKALEDLQNDNTNTVIVLGKGGDRKVVHVSDEDSVLVQSFLDRLFGDKED